MSPVEVTATLWNGSTLYPPRPPYPAGGIYDLSPFPAPGQRVVAPPLSADILLPNLTISAIPPTTAYIRRASLGVRLIPVGTCWKVVWLERDQCDHNCEQRGQLQRIL
jgi:hypothetical protein